MCGGKLKHRPYDWRSKWYVEAIFGYNNILDDGFNYPYDSKCLFFNYLLVSDNKSLVEIEHVYTYGTIERKTVFCNIPLQRNYCTSIYGPLITQDYNFNIEVSTLMMNDSEIEIITR